MSDYFTVEGRWEQTRNSPAHEKFFTIDSYCGTFEDAKSSARTYIAQHIAGNASEECLEWVEGILRKKRCWYAHTPVITLRISR